MMKIILTSLFLTYALVADTSLKLSKGWQFIGFPSDIDNTKAFNNTHVDIVWGFDAKTQKWLGFSPSSDTQNKITEGGYAPLKSIAPWQGVWIHNNDSWTISLKEETTTQSDITLSKGWNLVSLPADMTLSPSIFPEDIVWKYDKNAWQLSSQGTNKSDIAPPISKIDSAEALWVKSKEARTVSLSQSASALHTFPSKEAMKAYIKEMALESYKPRYDGYGGDDVIYTQEAMADGTSNGGTVAAVAQKASDTTGTNLQENDVDESDILKHDGEHIFFYDREKNAVRITNFSNLASSQDSSITPISLSQDTFLQAMYIYQSTLITVSNKQRYYYAQSVGLPVADFKPQKNDDISFDINMYDISDINNIQLLKSTNIDGTYNNSRITEGKLYIISQFSPRLEIEYPKIYIDSKKCEDPVFKTMLAYEDGGYIPECGGSYHENGRTYRYDYTKPSIKSAVLIPTINKGQQDLITHDTFYAPHKLNQFPTITTIAKFDLVNNQFDKSVSTAGHTNNLYASSKSIYLTSVQYPYYYNFRNNALREVIYKFSIGDDFDYKAKGFVQGTMLSQFSMSEKDGILRVATTSGNGWRGDTENSIFTLQENASKLDIVGTLSGLGKEGERIRGVRFLGDRGYIVTFKQTDPLYTINLSDATNPKKVGELSIPGFSSYIHPVDENYILTLGRDADADGRQAGFIVQLFNISDFANPTQADIKYYSINQSGFDAEYNPQAFIYRNSDKRFAITYHDNMSNNALMDVLQINTATGRIQTQDTLAIANGSYENRGVIFNLNNRIYSALFSSGKIASKQLGAIQ